MGRLKGSKNGVKPPTITESKKVHLVSYEVKAVIPTGMYANIQPCIIVEANTIEEAERVVMPHIEMLFAKYREGSAPLNVRTVVGKPVVDTKSSTDTTTLEVNQPVNVIPAKNVSNETIMPGEAVAAVPDAVIQKNNETMAALQTSGPGVAPAEPAIVLTVPFTRASGAIASCMSLEALQLVANQVEKSEKLIESEKVELRVLIAAKKEALTPKAE